MAETDNCESLNREDRSMKNKRGFNGNKINDSFNRKLISIVFPITVQFLMTALVSVSDALMLGFVDQTSMSAVSLAAQVQFVFSLFAMGIAIGLGIMIAQYHGKNDRKAIEAVTAPAMLINVIIGLAFTGAAIAAPRLLMKVFTDETELIEAGAAYLKTVSLSYIFMAISQIYLAELRNTGKAKISSLISSAAMFLNITLNLLLIFGLLGLPRMGVRGAALATAITRAVELVWSVAETMRKDSLSVSWNFRSMNMVLLRDFWYYTFPVLAASLVWGVAFSLHSVVLGHMGADAVAAYAIASITVQLMSCVLRGVGSAAGIMTGNMLGSGDLERGKEYGVRFAKLSGFVGVGTGSLIMLLSPAIVRLCTLDSGAKAYLGPMLIFLGFWVMAQSVNHVVLDGVFGAGGDTYFDMYTNIVVMWCISLPLGIAGAFVLNMGVIPVFILINLDEIIKLPAVIHRFRKYIWVRNITRNEII